VELFRKSSVENPGKMYGKAMAVYKLYMEEGATREINVDSATRNSIFRKLQLSLFDNEVFDPVQDSIFRLLSTDCFPKFALTPEYETWRKSIGKSKQFPTWFMGAAQADAQRAMLRVRSSSMSSAMAASLISGREREREGPYGLGWSGGDRGIFVKRDPAQTAAANSTPNAKEDIVYVDKQALLHTLQDVVGSQLMRKFFETSLPTAIVPFDAWVEMEVFRLTADDSPHSFYNGAGSLNRKVGSVLNPKAFFSRATSLNNKYVVVGGSSDLGISEAVRNDIKRKLTISLFDGELFVRVQGEIIVKLMEPYMKFTFSELYKEYKDVKSKTKKKTKSKAELALPRNLALYYDILTKKELGK